MNVNLTLYQEDILDTGMMVASEGIFGVVLDTKTCFECIDDGQCRNDMKCDVIGHECVVADCLRDNHCSSGQKCENKKCTPPNCNGRKKRQAETCSSEPSEECKAQLGYCGNPSACPGNVLDNLCPGGQDNKCCVGMPFQEDECTAADGICGDKCACDGEVLHGLCPSQPNSIKCCPKNSTITESQPEQCQMETETGGTEETDTSGDCSQITCSSGLT